MRLRLAALQARWRWSALARPGDAAGLHLTLHFIGAVPAARVPALLTGLRVDTPRFSLVFDGAALWPNHCAVFEPTAVPPALLALHAALARRLREHDLPPEARTFRPHVTVARRAAGCLPPETFDPLRWPVTGYALVRSDGGHYTPIARYPLP